MGIITSKEDLRVYVEETGFLPLYQNEIPGFSVEELTGSGRFRSGDRTLDPLCWKRELSGDKSMAFAAFFDGREGYISREWFPVFRAYRRRCQLPGQEEICWDHLRREISRQGFATRNSCRKLLENFGSVSGPDRFLKHLQAETYLIQEYSKREIHYILPEQRWGESHVCSCPAGKEEAWEKMTVRLQKLYPGLTQRQLLKVLGAGSDRRAIVRQKNSYPDNLLGRLCQRESISGRNKEDSVQLDLLLNRVPDREQRKSLAEDLLAGIRERERELILLRYKEQMTVAKICEKTGLSDEYVRKRIRNGIRRIQSQTQGSFLISP